MGRGQQYGGFSCPDVPDLSAPPPSSKPSPPEGNPQNAQDEIHADHPAEETLSAGTSTNIEDSVPQPQPLSKSGQIQPGFHLGLASGAAALAAVGIPLLVTRLKSRRRAKALPRPPVRGRLVRQSSNSQPSQEEVAAGPQMGQDTQACVNLLRGMQKNSAERDCSSDTIAPETPENEPSTPLGSPNVGGLPPGPAGAATDDAQPTVGRVADAQPKKATQPRLSECPELNASESPVRQAGGATAGGAGCGPDTTPSRKSVELQLGQGPSMDGSISVKLAVMSFELPPTQAERSKSLGPVDAPELQGSAGATPGRVQQLIRAHSQVENSTPLLRRSLSRVSIPMDGTPEWPPQRKLSINGTGSHGNGGDRPPAAASVDSRALKAAGIDVSANEYTALFFFRGTWCQEDRAQLRQLSDEGPALRAQGVGIHCVTAEPGGVEELVARLQDRCVRGSSLLQSVEIHCDPYLRLCAKPFGTIHCSEPVQAKQRFGDPYEDYVMVQPALVVLDSTGATKLQWSWLTMEGVDVSDPMACVRAPGHEDVAPLVSLRPVPKDIIPAIKADRAVNVHSVTHQGIHGTPLHKV